MEIFGGNASFIGTKVTVPAQLQEKAAALSAQGKTPLFFGGAGRLLDIIAVADTIKEDSPRAIRELQAMGIRVVMLTGTNNCTYYDIIKAFRMFWDKPLYYREDPEIPATMIFETDTLPPEVDVARLLTAPFIKAAGVAIKIIAKTETSEMMTELPISGVVGRGYMVTTLPEIPVGEDFIDTVLPVPAAQNITQTKLPEIEED